MIEISGTLLRTINGDLVLHRRDNKAPTSPNLLGLFGGHAEPGELPEQTAVRELAEEVSLDVSKLDLRFIAEFEIQDSSSKKMYHFNTYTAVVPSTDFEVYEGVGSEVYTVEDALSRSDLTRSTRITIMKLQEQA